MSSASPSIVEAVNRQRAAFREHIAWLCGIVEAKIEVDHIPDELKSQIRTIIKTITADFECLMQMRRDDDFLKQLVEKSPPAQASIEQLRADYNALATELPEISEQLVDEVHALKTRKRLHQWLTRLESLDDREFALVMKVWNTDIGAAD